MSGSKGTNMPVPPLGSSSVGSTPISSSTARNQPHGGRPSSSGAKGSSSHVPATGTPNKPNQQRSYKSCPAPQPASKKANPKAKGLSFY